MANVFGLGDGGPLVLAAKPNLARMLSASNPVPPQDNRNAWSGASSIRFALVIGYLQHPDAKIRACAVELGVRYCGHTYGFQDRLVELAADPDPRVGLAAVSALWTVHRESSCERVVQSLRDEIRGHTNDFGLPAAAGLRLGPDRARVALDLLVEHAPDEGARRGVLALIEHYITSS
ncbi:MAG TPA: hypothetical protein VHZ97_16700 [Pseudonocardiaceae bacterium]|nr:hypothetical protein [Pseudonocardiaceae bacterium]